MKGRKRKHHYPELDRAIEIVGGPKELAAALGVSPQMVGYWRKTGYVNAEWCRLIEAATNGQVSRSDLRPDIFGGLIFQKGTFIP